MVHSFLFFYLFVRFSPQSSFLSNSCLKLLRLGSCNLVQMLGTTRHIEGWRTGLLLIFIFSIYLSVFLSNISLALLQNKCLNMVQLMGMTHCIDGRRAGLLIFILPLICPFSFSSVMYFLQTFLWKYCI